MQGIADAYIRLRKKTGWYQGGEDLLKVLSGAAELCHEAGVTPDVYVAALARACPTPQFYPTWLKSKAAVKHCRDYAASAKTSVSDELAVQSAYLLIAVTKAMRPVEEILADGHLDFSPWFRILITKKPDPTLISRYKDDAARALTEADRRFLASKGFDISRLT